MLKFHLISTLLIATILLSLSSCGEDNLVSPSNLDESTPASSTFHYGEFIDLRDGTVAFQDLASAQRFFEAMKADPTHEEGYYNFLGSFTVGKAFNSLEPFQSIELVSDADRSKLIAIGEIRHKLAAEVFGEKRAYDSDIRLNGFIADDQFAAILNQDGKIFIGEDTYEYTPFGLFVYEAAQVEADHLSQIHDAEYLRVLISRYTNGAKLEEILPGIRYFKPAPVTGHTAATRKIAEGSTPKDLNEDALNMCGGASSSTLWNLFGPSSDCSDHFSKRERVKTKIWNQNFYVFSSLGMSVRKQKRFGRVWWANKADELELGCSFLDFEFPTGIDRGSPFQDQNRIDQLFGIRMNDGTFFDFRGNVLNSGPVFEAMQSIADNLPETEIVNGIENIEVRVFVNVFGRRFNETFRAGDYFDWRDLLDSQIEGLVNGVLRDIDPNAGLRDDEIEFIDPSTDRMVATAQAIERNRRNIANMSHYFDFNTGQIGVTLGDGFEINTDDLTNAFSYDILRGLVWGAAREGRSTRGNWVGMSVDN